MTKRKRDDRFNTSIPDLIEEFRNIMEVVVTDPEIPLPWPHFVPAPKQFHDRLRWLETAFHAYLETRDTSGHNRELFHEVTTARRLVKTAFARIASHVQQGMTPKSHLRPWPGFDQARNPGQNRPEIRRTGS
ncbi:MAG TPA: hypothetical protein VJ550_01825 [Geomonas sp.]|nr:hypothetical protein [Geomonas sp.]